MPQQGTSVFQKALTLKMRNAIFLSMSDTTNLTHKEETFFGPVTNPKIEPNWNPKKP